MHSRPKFNDDLIILGRNFSLLGFAFIKKDQPWEQLTDFPKHLRIVQIVLQRISQNSLFCGIYLSKTAAV